MSMERRWRKSWPHAPWGTSAWAQTRTSTAGGKLSGHHDPKGTLVVISEAQDVSDALAQNVLGLSAYAWWDDHLYTEFGLYDSLSSDFLERVGVDPGDKRLSDLFASAPGAGAKLGEGHALFPAIDQK